VNPRKGGYNEIPRKKQLEERVPIPIEGNKQKIGGKRERDKNLLPMVKRGREKKEKKANICAVAEGVEKKGRGSKS